MRTRQMSTAFLFNEHDVLMMRRSPRAKLFPGMWAPIGGHLEPSEIQSPFAAFEREVHEETGLSLRDLVDVQLKYIVHRLRADELRIQYVYFAKATRRDVTANSEGELHWVPLHRALNLDVTATTRLTL